MASFHSSEQQDRYSLSGNFTRASSYQGETAIPASGTVTYDLVFFNSFFSQFKPVMYTLKSPLVVRCYLQGGFVKAGTGGPVQINSCTLLVPNYMLSSENSALLMKQQRDNIIEKSYIDTQVNK